MHKNTTCVQKLKYVLVFKLKKIIPCRNDRKKVGYNDVISDERHQQDFGKF